MAGIQVHSKAFSLVETGDCNQWFESNKAGESHRGIFEIFLLHKKLLNEEIGL